MSGKIDWGKAEKVKIGIMAVLLGFALVSMYHFHWLAHTFTISIHIFYIPIILACIWWRRKGILVALFLSTNLLLSHIFKELHPGEILTSVMFVAVALLISEMGRQTAKAEEETEIWHENFNQIFDAAGNGLVVIDRDFTIKQCNEAYLNLTGLEKAQVIGKKCFNTFPCVHCHTPLCTLRQILNGRKRVECDTEKERADGVKIFCILTATPFLGPKGEIVGIVEDFKNISDRKASEKNIRESEERYRSFVKNFKGIAYQSDSNFRPIFCHGSVKEITGYSEEDLICGNPRWEQIVHKDDLPKIMRRFEKLCKDRNCVCEREYRIFRKDGEVRWVEEIIQNLSDGSGQPSLIQGIIYDITERKRTEEALRKTEERLLRAQKLEAIGRLAGGIAHDFNNLLTIINGNSGLILDDLEEGHPLRSDIAEIHRAGERASALTSQLLAFSRRQILQPKVLNLNKVLSETDKMLRRIIGEDIELKTLLDPDILRIKADPGQIEQIILNLAVNARDAMPHGGTLTIRTESVVLEEEDCRIMNEARPGKFVRLSIEDTGTGMDKDMLGKIFEPFFTTKEPGVGTGLGLSTAYGIVKQHEGWIHVYSEPGYGSIFHVYLPALAGKELHRRKEPVSLKKLQGTGERILIVEDEDGVRRFAKKALEMNGFVVFEAANALQALSLFDRERGDLDLVLTDVVLPDINGVQLAGQLKEKNPELRIILCSGYSYINLQWSVIKEKGFHFIKKPYNAYDLLKVLKEVKKLIKTKENANSKKVS
ncbi:MAG: PAS domain S-box protein [bacterium]